MACCKSCANTTRKRTASSWVEPTGQRCLVVAVLSFSLLPFAFLSYFFSALLACAHLVLCLSVCLSLSVSLPLSTLSRLFSIRLTRSLAFFYFPRPAFRKQEADRLTRGVNILIGTPGRLLDHLQVCPLSISFENEYLRLFCCCTCCSLCL